ncbi:hypothetical protein HBB16_10200 [Pseudonocardia sp. MCCB 268]|nr:hypothetical protein [Pseudonocardia cytotoxica]
MGPGHEPAPDVRALLSGTARLRDRYALRAGWTCWRRPGSPRSGAKSVAYRVRAADRGRPARPARRQGRDTTRPGPPRRASLAASGFRQVTARLWARGVIRLPGARRHRIGPRAAVDVVRQAARRAPGLTQRASCERRVAAARSSFASAELGGSVALPATAVTLLERGRLLGETRRCSRAVAAQGPQHLLLGDGRYRIPGGAAGPGAR